MLSICISQYDIMFFRSVLFLTIKYFLSRYSLYYIFTFINVAFILAYCDVMFLLLYTYILFALLVVLLFGLYI